jgi:hypothetical protein
MYIHYGVKEHKQKIFNKEVKLNALNSMTNEEIHDTISKIFISNLSRRSPQSPIQVEKYLKKALENYPRREKLSLASQLLE